MDFKFEDAEPVAPTGGKTAAPNPFVDIVQSIALQVDDAGKAKAKSFVVDVPADEDEAESFLTKLRRQIGQCGKMVTPVCTVKTHLSPATYKNGNQISGQMRITFWTKTPDAPRTRKVNADTVPAE